MARIFHYDIGWRTGSQHPGRHRSWHTGAGLEFRGHAPLLGAGDARRIDLLASFKDPFGQWLVRTYRQRSAISVYVVADLSASMQGPPDTRKWNVLADLTESAAESAFRSGDAFGFIGADEQLLPQFWLPATRMRGAGAVLAAQLRGFVPWGRSADGLLSAVARLPRRRSLVFLASDFHFPLARVDALIRALSGHAVVPVIVWDRAEFSPRAGWRIQHVHDSESSSARVLLSRPALRRKLESAYQHRFELLRERFTHQDMPPLLLTDGFRADLVTRHFITRSAHLSIGVN